MNKTPVSILQELMVQRKEHMPDYIIENSDRPGDFKCTVKICGYEVFDFASTKQQAKQNSAKKALLLLGVNNVGQQSSSAIKQQNELYINYVGKLNEFASTHKKSYPIYCDNIVHLNGNFVTQCNFMKWTTEGYGPKKKDSKQDAARMMLEKIRTEDVSIITDNVESLTLEKAQKIDKLNDKILRNYEKLSSSVDKVISELTIFQPIPNLKESVTSLEELRKKMEKYGYQYTLDTFQRNPYIMMMNIKYTKAVLMGKGDSKEEALRDLYESAILMFTHGFSLNTTL